MKKKCPYCAEEILIDAKKCKYCGEFLTEELKTQNTNKGIQGVIAPKMNRLRFLMLTISIIGLLPTFMSFYTLGNRVIYGYQNVGLYTFLLFLISTILLLLNDRKKPIKKGILLTCIILSIITGIIGIQKIYEFTSLLSGIPNIYIQQRLANSSIGIGLYLLVLTSFILPSLPLFIKEKKI